MTEKEKKSRNTIHLPEDLLVEILSRVPDASLARFRSTSKGWNCLIKKEVKLAKKSLVVMLIDDRVYFASSDVYALGKSSCNNEYKILRIHHHGDEGGRFQGPGDMARLWMGILTVPSA
ncbi:hypothetical protein Bca52824_026180 [Brassica carinata]|uniref:F-box domain-containing protein n=1 Tax=Brassica carinata TaxID=52824 RepID=A0A8X7SI39_BRACI|nr:hypothetical protein Bca52824_026180 [Brassica carinata]